MDNGKQTRRKVQLRYNLDYGQTERQCNCCLEWWPNDKEFFSNNNHGKLSTICRDCFNIKYRQKELAQRKLKKANERVEDVLSSVALS